MTNPNWSRFDSKLKDTLCWLSLFRFSDYSILSHVIGLPDSNNRRFFKLLETKGFIKVFTRDCVRQKLFMLTQQGKVEAQAYSRFAASYNTDSSKILNFIIIHDLLLQKEVLRLGYFKSKFILLPSKQNKNYTISQVYSLNPDCLVIDPSRNHLVAVELERSTKKYKDRMWLFQRYVEALRSNQVHDVIISFNNQSRLETYQNDLEQEIWPVYKKSNEHLKQLRYPEVISRRKPHGLPDIDRSRIPLEYKNRFHFILQGQDCPILEPKRKVTLDKIGEIEFKRFMMNKNDHFKLLPQNKKWNTDSLQPLKRYMS